MGYINSNLKSTLTYADAYSISGVSQSFSVTNTATVKRLKVFAFRRGDFSGNVIASIYTHSGTFGTSSVPTGTALAVSDPVDILTIGTGTDNNKRSVIFNFSGAQQISLSGGTNYVFALEYPSGGVNNSRLTIEEIVPGQHEGNIATYNGSVWTAASHELAFILYDDQPNEIVGMHLKQGFQ